MGLSRFFWTSGLALFIGGISYSAGWILFAAIDPEHNQYSSFWWRPLNFMVIVGSILAARRKSSRGFLPRFPEAWVSPTSC